jgi:predicted GIY-YIG superfamily endonuclease
MGQLLLISDPEPLVERLGRKFFRNAPKRPGVYLMRDAADKILYVGKAKNLRQRLGSYRIANPDKMPRRHLKMLRQVARIEFQFRPNEAAALKHESKLIRSLKPRFNRAGVWPGKTRFIVWRMVREHLELALVDVPEPTWQRFCLPGASSRFLHQTLSRILWLALNPSRAYTELPTGWARGNVAQSVTIHCHDSIVEIASLLDAFFWKSPDGFMQWLATQFSMRTNSFEHSAIESDLKILKDFSAKQIPVSEQVSQLALL